MPTQENWLGEQVVKSTWTNHLTPDELALSFGKLSSFVHGANHTVHVLFDITTAQRIPSQAPVLFIRSNMTTAPNIGRIAVIGTNPFAQVLAQIAVKMTGHDIMFFATEEKALNYLKMTYLSPSYDASQGISPL